MREIRCATSDGFFRLTLISCAALKADIAAEPGAEQLEFDGSATFLFALFAQGHRITQAGKDQPINMCAFEIRCALDIDAGRYVDAAAEQHRLALSRRAVQRNVVVALEVPFQDALEIAAGEIGAVKLVVGRGCRLLRGCCSAAPRR